MMEVHCQLEVAAISLRMVGPALAAEATAAP